MFSETNFPFNSTYFLLANKQVLLRFNIWHAWTKISPAMFWTKQWQVPFEYWSKSSYQAMSILVVLKHLPKTQGKLHLTDLSGAVEKDF